MDERRRWYNSNTTNLAFVGDAVYEVFVRSRLVERSRAGTKVLHRQAVAYVSAAGQAYSIKAMFDDLTEEEQSLVKRARNHRSATVPKNQDPLDYKWATALEALFGFLYLVHEEERLSELMEQAAVLTEERQREERKQK